MELRIYQVLVQSGKNVQTKGFKASKPWIAIDKAVQDFLRLHPQTATRITKLSSPVQLTVKLRRIG